MSDDVMIMVPLNEMKDAKEMLHKAITPSVPFNKDMKLMTEKRDEERERLLYLLLGWIQQKV